MSSADDSLRGYRCGYTSLKTGTRCVKVSSNSFNTITHVIQLATRQYNYKATAQIMLGPNKPVIKSQTKTKRLIRCSQNTSLQYVRRTERNVLDQLWKQNIRKEEFQEAGEIRIAILTYLTPNRNLKRLVALGY